MRARLLTGMLLAGLAGDASAQSGLATYSIAFGSPAGPSQTVLAPGESTWVYVNVTLEPGIGGTWGNGTVLGLSDGRFSIAGSGAPGSWNTLHIVQPYEAVKWPIWSTSGSTVSDIVWMLGFLFTPPHPSPFSPDDVFVGRFTAGQTPGTTMLQVVDMTSTGVLVTTPPVTLPGYAVFQSVAAAPAQVTISGCYPDCDHSGALTVADFGCFQAAFAGGTPYADCDQSGALTIADFGCFQASFVAGCP